MKVAIIMGSKSDYPVVEKAEKMLDNFGGRLKKTDSEQ